MVRVRGMWFALLAAVVVAGVARADLTESLKSGTPEIKSVGPLAFGPDGVLFVGDTQGAAIFAIDTGDRTPTPAGPFKVAGIDEKIASLLGTTPKDLLVNDLAVNPASGRAYLSISRGKGPSAMPVLVRTDNKGKVEEVSLKDVKFAKASLTNASVKQRQESITHLAYVKGQVFVSGLSNEDFASRLRSIPFPFSDSNVSAGIRIYHGAHGKFETNSPVRTFVPFDIKGEAHILAAYTCTPLVKIPLSQLKAGAEVQGVTVAELGNRNRPLDMIAYEKDGKEYILMSNNSRGMMKINTTDIDKIEGITQPIKDGAKAGLTYDTIAELKDVQQMDKLDKEHALVLLRTTEGSLDLQSIMLP